MANHILTISPLWNDPAKILFASSVFYFRLDDSGEFSIETVSLFVPSKAPDMLGKLKKPQAIQSFLKYLQKQGVQIIDPLAAGKDLEDAIDSICHQYQITL